MSPAVRLWLSAVSFLVVGFFTLEMQGAWHPLWRVAAELHLEDPIVGSHFGYPVWLAQVFGAFSLGWPLLGFGASAVAARSATPPSEHPIVAALAGIQALLGLGGAVVLAWPAEAGGQMMQPLWVLLHFLPLWATRPPWKNAFVPAIAFGGAVTLFFTLTAQSQWAKQAAEPEIRSRRPKEGVLVDRFPNGRKRTESSWHDGQKEGLATRWYESGQKETEVIYRDGKEEGPFHKWHPSGATAWTVEYRAGKREGWSVELHPNGRKAREGAFRADLEEGEWVEWDEAGQETSRRVYRAGVLISPAPDAGS